MSIMKRSLAPLLIVLFMCFVVVVVTYAWYRMKMVAPYEKFLSAERYTLSMFDLLNENIAQSLPPLPPNTVFKKKGSTGINAPLYEHGRWLRLEFSTTQTSDFILNYYRTFFVKHGWQENTAQHAFDHLFYYIGTSCVEITPPSDKYPFYEIEIWHDFKSQSFSPEIPDPKTMSWFETGMANFATCP